MALSRDKKNEQIAQVTDLLNESKLTVLAKYSGTPVKSMQSLRRDSSQHGTVVKVIKNRLFLRAIASHPTLKQVDTSLVSGQLLYAFNAQDEVAPAQNLAEFAEQEPQLQFVVGFTADGLLVTAQELDALAKLPSKEQLRGMVVGTIAAPLNGVMNVVTGNLRGLLNILTARQQSIT